MSIEITGRITSHEILNRVLLNMNDLYKKIRFIRCPTFLGYIAELSLTRMHEGMSGVIYVTDSALKTYLEKQYGDDLNNPEKFGQLLTSDVSDYLDGAGHGKLSDFLPKCLPYHKDNTPGVYAYSGGGLIMPFDMDNYVVGSDGEKAVLIHCLILEYFRKEMDKPLDEVRPFIGGIDDWVEDKINLFATLRWKPEIENVWIHSLLDPSVTTTGKLEWNNGDGIYGWTKPYIEFEGDESTKTYVTDFTASGLTVEKYWEKLTSGIMRSELSNAPYNKYDAGGMYDKINIVDPKVPMLKVVDGKVIFHSQLPLPSSVKPSQAELKDWLKRIAVLHYLFNHPPVIK